MLTLTLVPAEFWKAPVDDARYTGFDSKLIGVTTTGGSVQVSKSSIDIEAVPNSNPSVNLATTQLLRLNASIDVVIAENDGAIEPFRFGVWSPWTVSGQFIVFGGAPTNPITVESISNGIPGPTLVGGDVANAHAVGNYQLGKPYHVGISVDRAAGFIETSVSGDGVTSGDVTVGANMLPSLFTNVQLSLNAAAPTGLGSSHLVLRNYDLTLPHERSWASKVSDPMATTLLVSLVVLGILAIAAAIVRRVPRRMRWPRLAVKRRVAVPIAGAIAVYLIGNALLFPLGGHPFDMGGERLWAYVASTYGPGQLYYLPSVVSLNWIWHGAPYIQSAFPYEPVSAYLSTATGWLNSLVSGDWSFGPDNNVLEYLAKGGNVLFGLADSALIYLILRQLGATVRLGLLASALFLFNPAVWFSMSVWGQTHVFSLFLVLAAVLMAEKDRPIWAWLALGAACLTRPQMLVFGLVLGIVFLRKFSWRQNAVGLSWAVIVSFVLLAPLTLATSPSLPVDILRQNFHVQEAGGNVAILTTVSQDGLSIWPLVTYLAHGASGVQREFTASSDIVVGSLTYQLAGQILTAAALILVSVLLLFRRRASLADGGYIPFVALGITSFLMLLTGILATHFLLALPFLLLSYRWMGKVAYFYIAAIWTITTFVPMYGDMGVGIQGLDYPLLAPAHNAVTKFVVDLYSWDRFITVAVVANMAVVGWLAYLTLWSSPGERFAADVAQA